MSDNTVGVLPATGVQSAQSYPSSYYMDTTVISKVIEPEGRLYDDLGVAESDQNYWRFCAPGAAAAAITSWRGASYLNRGLQAYIEPYGPHRTSYTWGPSDTGGTSDTHNGYPSVGRSAIVNIAELVDPPSFTWPGLDDFHAYPTAGANINDIRDVLNWESSNHSSGWSTFFYSVRGTSGLTQARLLTDVETDISVTNLALVVVTLNTYVNSSVHLPNWSRNVGHAITITGYNNVNGTYRYIDTCGAQCGGGTNGGVHDVSQSVMYQLIMNFGKGYVW